ncbi:MAG: D-alanyl-D-alanine carboxypeptidase [Thermodesulfobacteriota bacterium]
MSVHPSRLGRLVLAGLMLFILSARSGQAGDWRAEIIELAREGAVSLADAAGRPLFEYNPDKPLVPASTIKILTAAAALELLGPDYRFTTEFRLTPEKDLHVIGRGDPYLISEEIEVLAEELRKKGLVKVRHLGLDNSFFTPGLVLDGTERSLSPYDAYNGALSVNFNTIFVQIGPGRKVVSAEPQTPLTALARDLALKSRARGKVRLNLAESPEMCLLYAGELIKAFLQKAGVQVTGGVRPVRSNPAAARPFHHHRSRKTLSELVAEMMEYSNNFMANQIFLTLGAEKHGPPATVEKARRVAADYLKSRGIPLFHLEEGSGLSARTRVTAKDLSAVVRGFEKHRGLLRRKEQLFYKGGGMTGVRSSAGFILPEKGKPLTFVILINDLQAKSDAPERILALLMENVIMK